MRLASILLLALTDFGRPAPATGLLVVLCLMEEGRDLKLGKTNNKTPSSPSSSCEQNFTASFLSCHAGCFKVVMGKVGKHPASVQSTFWEAVNTVFGQRPARVHKWDTEGGGEWKLQNSQQ